MKYKKRIARLGTWVCSRVWSKRKTLRNGGEGPPPPFRTGGKVKFSRAERGKLTGNLQKCVKGLLSELTTESNYETVPWKLRNCHPGFNIDLSFWREKIPYCQQKFEKWFQKVEWKVCQMRHKQRSGCRCISETANWSHQRQRCITGTLKEVKHGDILKNSWEYSLPQEMYKKYN